MKVAEIFAALGFKIEGAEKLDRVDRSLDSTARNATKATLTVSALSAAFLVLIDTSMAAAQALRNFTVSTGLSSDELQMWQHSAQLVGLKAGDMTDAFKRLQTARTNFALGDAESMGAWGWLGVQPTDMDPVKTLEKLREKLKGISDVGIARNLLGRVGLENLLPLLRSTDTEFENWKKHFIIDQGQVAKLTKLNREWQNLKASLISVKIQFSSLFVPALRVIGSVVQWVTDKVAVFVQWLNKGGPVAKMLRLALQFAAAGLLVLTGAVVALSSALALLVGLLGIATFLSWASGLAPVILALTTIATIIGGLIVLIDDFWHAISGGKSALGDLGIKLLGPVFTKILEFWQASEKVRKKGVENSPTIRDLFGSGAPPWSAGSPPAVGQQGADQTNNIDIRIDGAQDPRATGRAVANAG